VDNISLTDGRKRRRKRDKYVTINIEICATGNPTALESGA
jgi:hypothetical protein